MEVKKCVEKTRIINAGHCYEERFLIIIVD